MNLAQVRLAATGIVGLLSTTAPERDPMGTSLSHAAWMARELVTNHELSEGKAMRWYGYLQAMLVLHGVSSLEEEKERSRRASLIET